LSWNDKSLHKRVLTASVNIENSFTITGQNKVNVWVKRDFFYVIEFSRPFKMNRELPPIEGEKAKRFVLDFDTKSGENVMVKIALSTVSVEGAKLNLKTENSGWNFDSIKTKANDEWEKLLSRVQIDGSKDQKESFYTSLYHLS
jgi:putative alpha-1,2-mannosidase